MNLRSDADHATLHTTAQQIDIAPMSGLPTATKQGRRGAANKGNADHGMDTR